MSEEKVEKKMKTLSVAIAIDSEISVALMEKICKAVKERCGDTATVYVLEREDGDKAVRIFGTEEVSDVLP